MSDTVLKELNQGVLLLTLNRPAKKNAFNTEQWLACAEAFDEARKDDRVNVVVLTGGGNDFSSGQDLGETASRRRREGEWPYRALERALAAFDKPLLGAARGIAVGGGATILFFCDILYVGESLRMRFPFTSIGLAPEFACSYLLQARVGAQRAAELLLTSEWIDADRAVNLGIAAGKVPDGELLKEVLGKAGEIAQWPVGSLRETKKCMMAGRTAAIEATFEAERRAMAKQAGSPEHREAVTAFVEKRKPDFSNLKA
jgi:enoyl-CoA hydratase/carnithine racemase